MPATTRDLGVDVDLLALQSSDPARYPLLLESVAGSVSGSDAAAGKSLSRWDLLLLTDGCGFSLDTDGITRTLDGQVLAGDFLSHLDAQADATGAAGDDSPLPFQGGWALYLGYEMAGQIETRLRLPPSRAPLPDALALRCPAAIVRDRESGRTLAVAESGAGHWLATMASDVARMPAAGVAGTALTAVTLDEDAPERFVDGVARIHDYLRAGDVFQVNLSRGWRAAFDPAPDPAQVYAQLRASNPAPFAGLLRVGKTALLSSSPERLVSVRGARVETRPIAGTRPRFPGDDDQVRIRDLVGNPKERAEHVMLIDLERNDLGRVCQPGTVQVDELMSVESYAHVHHIVSNVSGELRPGTTPGEVIAAVFPGGTITGCPKVRCMQIIAELEGEGRGPYTGALGYLDNRGDMDLNILIRSAWLHDRSLCFRTGAGIVLDSDAGREVDETRAKARGLLRALGVDG